jgi:hypothetical protein
MINERRFPTFIIYHSSFIIFSLFFGEEGELRRRDYESQMERMSCLSLLINCIVTWNTHYMNSAIEQLKADGHPITDGTITHITPLMHTHINPYGIYYFNIPENE